MAYVHVALTHNSEGLTPPTQKPRKKKQKKKHLDQVWNMEYLGLELVLRARCGLQCANNRLMDPWTNTYAHTVQHTQAYALETDPHRILT